MRHIDLKGMIWLNFVAGSVEEKILGYVKRVECLIQLGYTSMNVIFCYI